MASENKPKAWVGREGVGRDILERLKPEEAAAVLRHLLEAHPDLSSEAETMARSLLRQTNYEDVVAAIEDEIRALDYDDLNARAGRHEWGYVEPAEAAGSALAVWYFGSDDPGRQKARGKKRPPLPPEFLRLVPKWIPMIERAGRERE
jgi:hypothetical protein